LYPVSLTNHFFSSGYWTPVSADVSAHCLQEVARLWSRLSSGPAVLQVHDVKIAQFLQVLSRTLWDRFAANLSFMATSFVKFRIS
jgi:hypothetical protein